jgi:predicted TIM-barrel fold metal-dependent hydrolase
MNEAAFAIVDAHQHFWDLERNYYPWLCDAQPIAFRYGDYSAIRKSYLPQDYAADAGGNPVVMTVHVEAEWDPRDPVGETRWLKRLAASNGLPSACVAQARLDHDDAQFVIAAQGAQPLVRGIRHKPSAAASPQLACRGALGSMDDPRWRRGYALLERHGLSFDLQTPWWHFDAAADLASDFPANLDHHQSHRSARRSQHRRAGGLACCDAYSGATSKRIREAIGVGTTGKSVDTGGERSDHSRYHCDLRHRSLHVRQQLSGGQAVRAVLDDCCLLSHRGSRTAAIGAAQAVPRQCRAHLSSMRRRATRKART